MQNAVASDSVVRIAWLLWRFFQQGGCGVRRGEEERVGIAFHGGEIGGRTKKDCGKPMSSMSTEGD